MTTLTRSHSTNRNRPVTDGASESSQTARYSAVGRYTDIDTLPRGTNRRAVRPGSYTDVDTITRPKTDAAVRPGSYIDIDAPSGRVAVIGRPGSYTDVDPSAR